MNVEKREGSGLNERVGKWKANKRKSVEREKEKKKKRNELG